MTEHGPKLIKIDGEWQYVPLTAEEIAQREADAAFDLEQQQLRQAELEAKESARQAGLAKLVALGLTEAEAQAIIG